MFTCSFCQTSFKDVKIMLKHMKLLHDAKEIFNYKCVQSNCYRNFEFLNSFRKHLKKHCLDDNSNNSTQKLDHTSSEKEYLSNEVYVDNFDDSAEEVAAEVLVSEDSKYLTSFEKFTEVVENKSLHFVSELYSNNTFCRKDIQHILNAVSELYKDALGIFRESLNDLISEYCIEESRKIIVFKYVNALQNIFTGLETEYFRLKKFEECEFYIKPVEYVVGEQIDKIYKGIGLPKTYTAEFIPMQIVLRKLFELPFIYKKTLQNIKAMEKEKHVSNIVNTDFWKSKVKNLNLSTNSTFPIIIYFDEYETGNPLGSHAGIHKLGAVYLSIPCIPQKFLAHLDNIFLALLFHRADYSEFGCSIVLNKLIEELIKLESEGITIKTESGTQNIYFCVCFVLGDNLGLNSILGFTESFRANFYCRFCKCDREEMQKQCEQVNEKLRNKSNYDSDLKKK